MRLTTRLERLEAKAPPPAHDRITEVHYRILNPDRTPAVNPDGMPMIIVRRVVAGARLEPPY